MIAEDLLELITRRYERASTLPSNRPVDNWGKLLGDTAAVTALLDRLCVRAEVTNMRRLVEVGGAVYVVVARDRRT